MSILTRPILEINLENLLSNYRQLSKLTTPATAAAVVKDDCYGLGAKIIVPILYQKANCRHFFAAHAIEAEKFIEQVPDAEIYILQGVGEDSLGIFKQYQQLVPVISSPDMLRFWQQNISPQRKVVFQVETGLNRLGFRESDLANLSSEDISCCTMVLSHLACGDEKDHFMNAYQLENFEKIKNTYFPKIAATLSASDGVFLGNNFHQNMVRLGAAMYGINTAPYRLSQMKNVVTVKAPILQVTDLPKGDFVGYSATYRASSNRRIAIVSIGYGDGVPRSLSNVGKIFVKTPNKLFESRIIGRVSMDNIICDITDAEDVKIGDIAYIAADFYTLDDVARDAGTISYELMSNIGKNLRFDRHYI